MCPEAVSSVADKGFFIKTDKGDHLKFVSTQQEGTVKNAEGRW